MTIAGSPVISFAAANGSFAAAGVFNVEPIETYVMIRDVHTMSNP